MAKHAKDALGVDTFWDLKVGFIQYDLDLATKRWDQVNRYYEYEIYRKWGELKSSLFLVEEVEGEVNAAKAKKVNVTKAEAKIKKRGNSLRWTEITRRLDWPLPRRGLCWLRVDGVCGVGRRAGSLSRPFSMKSSERIRHVSRQFHFDRFPVDGHCPSGGLPSVHSRAGKL